MQDEFICSYLIAIFLSYVAMISLDDKDAAAAQLLALIEEHLRTSGRTMGDFSKAVTGHDALLKNLRSGSLPSADKIKRIADEIGYEFYFGPPRYDGSHKYDGSIDHSGEAVVTIHPKPTTSPQDDRMARLEDMLSEVTAQLALIANRPGAPTGPYSPVPLYDVRAAAGGGAAVEFEEIETTLSFRRDWLLANGLTPSQCGLIRVIGDSMSPTLEEDDVMLIDFTARDLRPRHIYAIRDDGDLLVKRVVSDLGEPVRLGSDNPAYPPFALDNGAAVVGRVVWSARTYRKTPSAFSIVR